MFEEWKEIPNYESKYLISSRGRVMNANGIILKPMKCRNGYLVACLWKNNHQQKILIHRLVARCTQSVKKRSSFCLCWMRTNASNPLY